LLKEESRDWKWDPSFNKGKYQISNNNLTLRNTSKQGARYLVYGDKVMSVGIHQWGIRIDGGY